MYSCVIKNSARAADASEREEREQNTSQIPQRKGARPSLRTGSCGQVRKRRPGKQVLCRLSCIRIPGGKSAGEGQESSSQRACSSPGTERFLDLSR